MLAEYGLTVRDTERVLFIHYNARAHSSVAIFEAIRQLKVELLSKSPI